MTKSTFNNNNSGGRRWTTSFCIQRRMTLTTTTTESIMDCCPNISLLSYSTCILLILSTLWSTSFAGTTNRTVIATAQQGSKPIDEPPTQTTTDIPSILARSASDHSHHHNGGGGGGHQHKCYVCLPPDRSSREAQEILSLFNEDEQTTQIPDCASFTQNNQNIYEFKCPQEYRGCLLRIHGSSVSRSCARFQLNDCKTANSVEFCYCSGPLCNGQKLSGILPAAIPPGPLSDPDSNDSNSNGQGTPVETDSEEKAKARLLEEKEEAESRKFWQKGETDDEDLLEMQDDTGSSGDGDIVGGGAGAYPPGVIDQYTTTPKPTLVPNLRGESPKSKPTPPPASGGSNFVPLKFIKASSSISTSPLILCSFLILSSYHYFLVNRP